MFQYFCISGILTALLFYILYESNEWFREGIQEKFGLNKALLIALTLGWFLLPYIVIGLIYTFIFKK